MEQYEYVELGSLICALIIKILNVKVKLDEDESKVEYKAESLARRADSDYFSDGWVYAIGVCELGARIIRDG